MICVSFVELLFVQMQAVFKGRFLKFRMYLNFARFFFPELSKNTCSKEINKFN